MTKLSRRAAATAAAALALCAGTATLGASAASAAPALPAAPTCTSNQLVVWVSPDSASDGPGTTYYNLDITNTGTLACQLVGWPGVIATTGSGRSLGAPARDVNFPAAAAVVISGDGTASAALGYVYTRLNRGSRPQEATFLKVYLPGVFGAKRAFFPLPVSTRGASTLTIGSIQPGA